MNLNLFDSQINQKSLRSTGDRQFFMKLHKSQSRIDQNILPYANISMPKDIPKWNNSSSVLRHSSSLYTMPRSKRFNDPKVNYYCFQQLNIPSTLSKKGTNFGYASKRSNIPKVFSNNKNYESIGAPYYDIDDMTLRRNKSATIKNGKTFGIGWDSYQKVRAPHRSTVHNPEQTQQNPGMKYNISKQTGQQAQKSSIHSRLNMFTNLQADYKRQFPGPQSYQINQKLVSKSTRKTNFGLGRKSDFTQNKEKQTVPSPIYKISGFCDKFHTLKVKKGIKD